MTPRPHTLLWIFPLLICMGVCQSPLGQPSVEPAAEVHNALSGDEVVNEMIRRNLQRAEALAAFQATRIYRLEYRGFPGSRNAEMVVDVKYKAPATKEFIRAVDDRLQTTY